MKLYTNKKGDKRIHIEDTDNYDVTDDNGVDFFPTDEQVKQIIRVWTKKKAGAP